MPRYYCYQSIVFIKISKRGQIQLKELNSSTSYMNMNCYYLYIFADWKRRFHAFDFNRNILASAYQLCV